MAGATDSAGVPWEGRSFQHDTTFAGDDGSVPPAFAAAMRRFAEDGRQEAVVDSLRDVRLLVPLIAEAGDLGVTATGKTVDKTQELSIVTVEAPDGRPILPVFSSATAMRSWNPVARPVPIEIARVAAAGLESETKRIILDPTTDTEFVLRRPALEALLAGTPWISPIHDAQLHRALATRILSTPGVLQCAFYDEDPSARMAGSEFVIELELERPKVAATLQNDLNALILDLSADPLVLARLTEIDVRRQWRGAREQSTFAVPDGSLRFANEEQAPRRRFGFRRSRGA
ncbi:SseB family protein [Humidisolicoccus flavus]|uniref:SseB family protein n=1 Tax=Humidisolicoccus flavus TaxID=3111414 RepID=UPI003250F2BF